MPTPSDLTPRLADTLPEPNEAAVHMAMSILRLKRPANIASLPGGVLLFCEAPAHIPNPADITATDWEDA